MSLLIFYFGHFLMVHAEETESVITSPPAFLEAIKNSEGNEAATFHRRLALLKRNIEVRKDNLLKAARAQSSNINGTLEIRDSDLELVEDIVFHSKLEVIHAALEPIFKKSAKSKSSRVSKASWAQPSIKEKCDKAKDELELLKSKDTVDPETNQVIPGEDESDRVAFAILNIFCLDKASKEKKEGKDSISGA